MKKSTPSSPQYKNQHTIELNDIVESDDIKKLNKLLCTLYDSINTNTNEFIITSEQNNLLKSLDENVTPNFRNFKVALNEILTNNSLDINEKKTVLNYHISLTGMYVMRDIIEQEYRSLETYPIILTLSSSTQNSLVNLNTQKHQLNQILNIDNVPELPTSITPETANKYLKKLVDFDKNLSGATSGSINYNLADRLPRSLETFSIEKGVPIKGTHDVQKAKSTLLHDFGENYFLKNTIDRTILLTDNLELLLESVADKISSVSFPRTIAQVKNVSEIKSPLRTLGVELPNKITEEVSGVRSKIIPGVEFCYYQGDPKEIENFEEFISKSLVLLDPDCHTGNGFVHNKRLTKIDHGRIGWLNFKDMSQLEEFIRDRFINNDFWQRIPFDQEKLIKAMVNDLDKIDKSLLDDGSKIDKSNLRWVNEKNNNRNIIGTSFNEISRKFNIYPTAVPRIDNMNDYLELPWNLDVIETPAELTDFFTKRFEQQHSLQRAYVINHAIKLNLTFDGLDPITYIRQPGKELFLKTYNTLVLKSPEKPLVTIQNTTSERDITSPEIREAIFTADSPLKPIPKNAQDKVNKTFNIVNLLVNFFKRSPSCNPKKTKKSNEYLSKKTSSKKANNRVGHAK